MTDRRAGGFVHGTYRFVFHGHAPAHTVTRIPLPDGGEWSHRYLGIVRHVEDGWIASRHDYDPVTDRVIEERVGPARGQTWPSREAAAIALSVATDEARKPRQLTLPVDLQAAPRSASSVTKEAALTDLHLGWQAGREPRRPSDPRQAGGPPDA